MVKICSKMLFSIIMGLLASVGASQEVYDDPRYDVDIIYQNDKIDTNPTYSDMKYDETKDLMLYKLLRSIQNNDEYPELRDRSAWRVSDDKLLNGSIDSALNMATFMKPGQKRSLSNLPISGNKKKTLKSSAVGKPQPKPKKPKKGKNRGKH